MYGGYGGYGSDYGGGYGGYSSTQELESGKVRLKVKPRDAEVYVDGHYAGRVDEFDGTFQSLKLDTGPHRIEVRMAGYESLSFDVHVIGDHKTTLEGTLRKP